MRFVLLEGIEDVRKYYPAIADDVFNKLIALDPTFKEGKDKLGTYGKWILNLYKQHKLKDEDFYKVTDLLTQFEQNKRNFKNKDINQFKSLPDLYDALQNMEEVELTDRQKLRQTQNKIRQSMQDAEIVFDDAKWTVYIPKTYEASCKLGQGTHWCTASNTSDSYYNSYAMDGPLYILISKSNPNEKYQFHFETGSFMDKNDSPVRVVSVVGSDLKLLKFFSAIAKQYTDSNYVGNTNEIDLSKIDIEDMVSCWYGQHYDTRDWCDEEFVVAVLKGSGTPEYDAFFDIVNQWGWDNITYYFTSDNCAWYAGQMSDDNITRLAQKVNVTPEQMKFLLTKPDEDEVEEKGIDIDYEAFKGAYSRALGDALCYGFERTVFDDISKILANALSDVKSVSWDSNDTDFSKPIPVKGLSADIVAGTDTEIREAEKMANIIDAAQDENVDYYENDMLQVSGVDSAFIAGILIDWGGNCNFTQPRYGYDPEVDANEIADVMLDFTLDDEGF